MYNMPICKYCMDKNEFRARVAELAIIEDAKLPKVNDKARGADEVHEVIYDKQLVELSAEENPTLNFTLVSVKPISKLCEFPTCGKVVANQVIEYRHAQSPRPHWRTRCDNCMKYLHPDGESLIDDSRQVHAVEYAWIKNGGTLKSSAR